MARARSSSERRAAGRGRPLVSAAVVVAGFALALGAVGCYDPLLEDGHFTCADDNQCPSGFYCAQACQLCYHNTAAGKQLALTCAMNVSGDAGGSGQGTGGNYTGGSGGGGGEIGAAGGSVVGGGGGVTGIAGVSGGGGVSTGSGGHGGMIVGGSGGTPGGAGGMNGTAGAMGTAGHVGTGGVTGGMGGHAGAAGAMGAGGAIGTGGKIGTGGAVMGMGGAMMGMGGAMGLGGTPGTGGLPGLGLGATCSVGTQCASGFCADKVCCNVACDGQCQACDINPGTCSPVASGPPHGTRLACGGTGVCGAQCRLITPTSADCVSAPSTVSCGDQTCTGSTLTAAQFCNGAGTCMASASGPCPGNLKCNGQNACLASCTTSADCTAAAPNCNPGTHQCTTSRAIGSSCTVPADCQNSQCIDGFCCDQLCNGSCQVCDVMGQEGHCALVGSGQPHGLRTPCGASGSICGARCDGTDAQCHFPMSNSCTCPDGLGLIGSCDGKGDCMTVLNVCLL